MNKQNLIAYMFLLWAAFSFSGCAGKQPQMYLEAKTQEVPTQGEPDTDVAQPQREPEEAECATDSCFVYVCGAVKAPGVFELPSGSRVYEAIVLAGGLREDAYSKNINQAQRIEDGEMIEVLTIEEYRDQQEASAMAKEEEQQVQDGLIDINTASVTELMTLNGIGEAKAAAIIAYREDNGKFLASEDLMNVNGIGEGVYAKIKDKIKVVQ